MSRSYAEGEKKSTIITHLPATVLAHAGRKRTAKYAKNKKQPKGCCPAPTTTKTQTLPLMECQPWRGPGRGKGHMVRGFCFLLTCSSELQGRKLIQPNARPANRCLASRSSPPVTLCKRALISWRWERLLRVCGGCCCRLNSEGPNGSRHPSIVPPQAW